MLISTSLTYWCILHWWFGFALALSSSEPPAQQPRTAANTKNEKIAVIGSGASGLAAARVLSRNGYQPLVLEKEAFEGGVWKYRKRSKTDPVYRGLRTNLPKELMAYREFPWPPISENPVEDQSFLTHGEVLDYLQIYKDKFSLHDYIRRGCKVTNLNVLEGTTSSVSPEHEKWPKIQLEWEDQTASSGESAIKTDTFDAVLVCNGHYAKPSVPEIPGATEYFKGKTYHSLEYDDPTDFKDLRVLCIGARASGEDLAREIADVSSHLYLSSSTYPAGQPPKTEGKVTLVPRTVEVKKDGSVVFDGLSSERESVQVDAMIYCTGYDYSFPFIHDPDLLQAVPGERRVKPLYEQLFHAKYPNLCFLGLPHSVVPFPLFEFQAEAIVAQFEDCQLPSEDIRMKIASKDAVTGGPSGNGRVQDTHYLGSSQWDMMRKLAKLSGHYSENTENFISTSEKIYDHTGAERKGRFPGSQDVYRELVYRRDDGKRDFSTYNLLELEFTKTNY